MAGDLTSLLVAWRAGDPGALDQLTPLVYQELLRMARRQLRGERAGGTVDPTVLVHEAFVRLMDIRRVDWHDRVHFFAMAARVMRRVLIDQARARHSRKRAGGAIRVTRIRCPATMESRRLSPLRGA